MTRIQAVMRALRYAFVDLPYPDDALLVELSGQVLVLNYHTLTAAEGDRIKARIRADAPGLPVLLVCADTIGVSGASSECG